MANVVDELEGRCVSCIHRFRRVLLPEDPNDYVDEEGQPLTKYMQPDGTLIVDMCLKTMFPMGNDVTLECSCFVDKDSEGTLSIKNKLLFYGLK